MTTTKWQIDPAHSYIGFKARHAMVATVRGKFSEFSGTGEFDPSNLNTASGRVVIKAASVDTGVEMRDNHLRSADFLDVEKFDELVFESTEVRPGDSVDEFTLLGDLTIKGETHPIELRCEYQGEVTGIQGEQRLGVSGSGKINRSTWGLTYNAVLEAGGVMVSDEIKVEFEIAAVAAVEEDAEQPLENAA